MPASVSATTTPRASESALSRRTRPSSANRATRRLIPDREMSARSASSVMRNMPWAAALGEHVEVGQVQVGLQEGNDLAEEGGRTTLDHDGVVADEVGEAEDRHLG